MVGPLQAVDDAVDGAVVGRQVVRRGDAPGVIDSLERNVRVGRLEVQAGDVGGFKAQQAVGDALGLGAFLAATNLEKIDRRHENPGDDGHDQRVLGSHAGTVPWAYLT